jgi:predicted Ser/Thr protein kinase
LIVQTSQPAAERSRVEGEWASILRRLGIPHARLLSQSAIDPGRRIYVWKDIAYKVCCTAFDITATFRRNSLAGEYELLKRSAGIVGIPKALEYFSDSGFEAFSMQYVNGQPPRIGGFVFLRALVETLRFVVSLARRGISHNDYRLNNFVLSHDDQWFLVDFDQATEEPPPDALIAGFSGLMPRSKSRCHGSVLTVLKESCMSSAPAAVKRFLRGLVRRRLSKCPAIPAEAPRAVHNVLKAWQIAQRSDASSPGEQIAYYALDYGGYHFPGERPWVDRFSQIRRAIDVRGKRTLELGCNLGLLSHFMLMHEGALEAWAVDTDANILEGASLLADAFGTSPHFLQVNFDRTPDWEEKLLPYSADVVFALSVLNWIKDKDRFLHFLSKHNEVLFEGHESTRVEEARLRKCGFSTVRPVARTERGRDLFYCSK